MKLFQISEEDLGKLEAAMPMTLILDDAWKREAEAGN